MTFDAWWVQQIGHPPSDKEEERLFALSHLAWRAALAYGEREIVPAQVEKALLRVGEGESTHEDELLLRTRIEVTDLTARSLEHQLDQYAVLQEHVQAEQARQANWKPDGAEAMGGRRWRCPRCRFIGGLKRIELICRGCGYPGEDTREWTQESDGEAS